MNAETQFEVAIVGGGVVGAALARALGRAARGTRLALVSPQPRPGSRDSAANAAALDSRIYAISPGNAAFLSRLGAWADIPAERVTPVHAMRVFGDDGASFVEFDAYRAGTSELAWIVEDRLLQEALWRALESQDGLSRFASSSLQKLEIGEKRAKLLLLDGRNIDARLVVGADGARSRVRAQAGIPSEEHAYGQTAVVANFVCGRPHRNVAWQWFQGGLKGGAVLALLPLPGDHVSMVWSTGDAEAARLLALDAASLGREVAAASRHALGELAPIAPQRGFPLQRLAANRLVAPRVALAGDAAHVIHPLAGQGANLGLQDARALAEALATALDGRGPASDPGDLRLLRRYERSRAEAILAMRSTVHGLFRLFDARGAALSRLRNAGLNLADRIPVLKNVLMRHAMG